MKKILLSLLALSLFVGNSCQEIIDIEKEKEAIKAVLEEQTNAFLNRDFDRLAATYVQDETTIRLSANKSGYSSLIGWEQIGSAYKEYFENNPEPDTGKRVKTNHKIKVYKESAWSIFDEVHYDGGGEVFGKAIGVRILEKADGEWKIVYLSQVNTTSYDEEEDEDDDDDDDDENETKE